jgi:hypothetical protein
MLYKKKVVCIFNVVQYRYISTPMRKLDCQDDHSLQHGPRVPINGSGKPFQATSHVSGDIGHSTWPLGRSELWRVPSFGGEGQMMSFGSSFPPDPTAIGLALHFCRLGLEANQWRSDV